jgi:hypothetical protein
MNERYHMRKNVKQTEKIEWLDEDQKRKAKISQKTQMVFKISQKTLRIRIRIRIRIKII